jgi:hypothetical protein
MGAYHGFAAKLEGHDNINRWMRRFAYPHTVPLINDVLAGSTPTRRSSKFSEGVVIWMEGQPLPRDGGQLYLLIAHAHADAYSSVPGGTGEYDKNSIEEYNGTFRELTASTQEAVHAAFDELRGYRLWR